MRSALSYYSFYLAFFGLAARGVLSFAPSTISSRCSSSPKRRSTNNAPPTKTSASTTTTTTTTLYALDPVEMNGARGAFFFWFFGGSGGIGIALGAFPSMLANAMETKKLSGSSSTGNNSGGPSLTVPSFLTGYPEDVYLSEIEAIANFPLTTRQIVEKYPITDNYMSSRGYLTYPAFSQAHESNSSKASPLAVRAVFDAFSTSDTVNPDVAQATLDQCQQDPARLATPLLLNKLSGFAAILTFLLLLGVAEGITASYAYQGYFPEWPGAVDFPTHLFEPNAGLLDIPKYWVFDVPEL